METASIDLKSGEHPGGAPQPHVRQWRRHIHVQAWQTVCKWHDVARNPVRDDHPETSTLTGGPSPCPLNKNQTHLRGRLLGLPVHLLSSKGSPLLRGLLRGLMSLKHTSPLSAVPRSKLSRSAASAAADSNHSVVRLVVQALQRSGPAARQMLSKRQGPTAVEDQEQGAAPAAAVRPPLSSCTSTCGLRRYWKGCRICNSTFHESGQKVHVWSFCGVRPEGRLC